MTDQPMHKPVVQLKSQKFREAREGDWKALNRQLDKAEQKGLGSFSIDELLNLPVLYRSTMSSLSMAQSISLDRNMVTYLQALCARAYVYIYGPQTRLKDIFGGFFVRAWPKGIRALWPEILLSLVITVAGAVMGWALCAHSASWYSEIIPPSMVEGRDTNATVQQLRETLGGATKDSMLSVLAVFLMTHNTQVVIGAFAFGALFGVPTLIALLQNGAMLGAMLWLFWSKGLGFEFAAWLTIHGTTELFAIIIAGGCGFRIARRLMFPGDETRLTAMADAGRLSGTVMIGCAIMLTIAGCLEGFGRQLITPSFARIAVGVVMLAFWLLYFNLSGKKETLVGKAEA